MPSGCRTSPTCCTADSLCCGAASARSPGWKLSPADLRAADLHVRDSRPLDLTWMACMPSLSSARKARRERRPGVQCQGPARKLSAGALSVHQDGSRQGRLMVHEVERSSTSSELV